MVFRNADNEEVAYDGSSLSWRVSVYAVIAKDNEVLLIKNREEKLFDIPGGGVEINETLSEALKREAREEAGIEIEIGPIITATTGYFYHTKQKQFFKTLQLFYTASVVGQLGTPKDPRTEFVGFVKRSELPNYPLPDAVKHATY